MAKIKFGPSVQEMYGRIGNTVFQRFRAGMAIARTTASQISQPNSIRQNLIRSRVHAFANYWANTLDEPKRTLWDSAAKEKYGYRGIPSGGGTKSLIKGNTGSYFGISCFMLVNQNAADVGATTVLETPPPHAQIPAPVTGVALVYDGTKLTVTWTSSGHMPSDFVRVWLGANTGEPHRQVVDFAPATAETMNITTLKGVAGKPLPITTLENKEVLVQAEVISQATGLASMPSNCAYLRCVTPAP